MAGNVLGQAGALLLVKDLPIEDARLKEKGNKVKSNKLAEVVLRAMGNFKALATAKI